MRPDLLGFVFFLIVVGCFFGGGGWNTFVDLFAAFGVVEFGRSFGVGWASWMVRPLASEARGRQRRPTSTEWTIEIGL